MGNFRRRLMMQRKAGILPAGYTQLEYIERDASNQGYINTGIKMMHTYAMTLDFNPVTLGDYIPLWGGEYFSLTSRTRSKLYLLNFSTRSTSVNDLLSAGQWYHVVLDNMSLNIDDRTFKGGTTDDTYTFLLMNNQRYKRQSYSQVAYFKVSIGDAMLMELIPAKRNSDSVVGMYDLVSNKFITPTGGTVKAGPKV